MNEELKKIFIKQMLLPKEELAMQTMELLADKMNLQSKINKAIELIEKEDLIAYFRETNDLTLANKFEDLYKDLKEDK